MKIHNSKSSVNLSLGYSLVELLISMSLGVFLMTGVFQVNQTNQKSHDLQKALEQTQKNGRFAIDNLSYAIKTAGYSGFYDSFTSGVENLLNLPNNTKWNISNPTVGFDNVPSSRTIIGITGFTPNTDVLLLKSMSRNVVPVVNNANSNTIVAATNIAFSAGDIVVVSDVDQASIFQANNINIAGNNTTLSFAVGAGNPGNSKLLANSFNSSAEISKYDLQMFYIKAGRNGSPALFKAIMVNTAGVTQLQESELVSDIRNMQIIYGIDNNNDQVIDAYEDASVVADWKNLISINIALLANSSRDNILPEKSSFGFNTSRITFVKDASASSLADKRLKRVFRTSLPLRN